MHVLVLMSKSKAAKSSLSVRSLRQ